MRQERQRRTAAVLGLGLILRVTFLEEICEEILAKARRAGPKGRQNL